MTQSRPDEGPVESGQQGSEQQPETDPRWRPSRNKIIVAVLLVLATLVPLLVPTYSHIEPRFLGFPFFYWYQMLWVFLAAGICGICYALIRRDERAFEARRADEQDRGE